MSLDSPKGGCVCWKPGHVLAVVRAAAVVRGVVISICRHASVRGGC